MPDGDGHPRRVMTIRTAAAKQRALTQDVDLGAGCTIPGVECAGFELHIWRKRCKNCGYSREDHDIDLMPGMNRPTRKIEKEDVPEPEPEVKKKRVMTAEERKRFAHQFPKHDHDSDACSGLTDENQTAAFERLREKRNEMFGVGVPEKADAEIKCHRSKKSIKKGDDIITVPGLGQTYLEEHFTCFNCGERLAADNYFEYEDEVYCGRCHAEKFMPRCSGCDELIFDPTYTVAENRKWHTMHFCCWVCDIDLCEKQYAKDKDANPVCLPCYNEKYAPTCSTCNKPVAAGARAMKVGEQTYCHNAECFKCKACDKALEGEKCIAHEGALMCSPCYRKTHSPPCARCDKQIRGEFVEVRGKRYCKTCFTCGKCTKAFTREEKGGAYPVGDDLLCYECALETRRAEIRAKKKAAQAAEEAAAAEAAAAEAAKSAADAAAAEAAAQKAAEEAAAVRESEATMLKDLNNQKTDAIESGGSEAKANEGGFVRQGTRKVTRLSKKMPPKSKSSASVANSTPVPAEIEEDGGGDDEVEASGITEEDVRTPITQEKEVDPFAALWAGFSIPKKLSKFSLDIPGREILDTGGFFLIEKKFTAKVFLVLATDVIFLVQMVDESLYELMMMPELRNKVKAKVSKLKDAVAMDVKIGSKTYTLKCANETERAIWCGKLNAPIGFITTKALQ